MKTRLPLTKEEARLCRTAAKDYGDGLPLLKTGTAELTRAQWWDLMRCLEWASTDMELKRWLEERKAMGKLASRIEEFVDGLPVEIEAPVPTVKVQRDLFAGVEG